MKNVYIYFVKKYTYKRISLNKIMSWLINLFTFGKYFHCGVYIDENVDYSDNDTLVIESQFRADGVIKTKLDTYNKNVVMDVYEIKVPKEKYDIIFNFLNKEVNDGAKYDLNGALSCVFRWIHQNRNKYFCSELIVTAFKTAEIILSDEKVYNTSPNKLAKSNKLKLVKENVIIYGD